MISRSCSTPWMVVPWSEMNVQLSATAANSGPSFFEKYAAMMLSASAGSRSADAISFADTRLPLSWVRMVVAWREGRAFLFCSLYIVTLPSAIAGRRERTLRHRLADREIGIGALNGGGGATRVLRRWCCFICRAFVLMENAFMPGFPIILAASHYTAICNMPLVGVRTAQQTKPRGRSMNIAMAGGALGASGVGSFDALGAKHAGTCAMRLREGLGGDAWATA